MPSYQNPNQFAQSAILGMPDLRSQPNVLFATIDPASEFDDFQVGTVLKLVAGAGPQILVDAAESTDEPFAVIPYDVKRNVYLPGATVQLFAELSVLYLQASAAVDRGAKVEFLNTGGSPTVAEQSGANTALGVALDQASGSGDLIRVQIKPSAAVSS